MQTNTQTEIINFDRHEIYTDEMMDMNLKLVRDPKNHEYTNILFGLMDGYLYPRLLESTNPTIQKLINLINQKIK